jgi:6-phosphogluconolactonase/glucosamine-6-phosphate isomerase/deaminase
MTLGAAKAETLERVFHGSFAPQQLPIQLMRHWHERVVWFVDDAAAARL